MKKITYIHNAQLVLERGILWDGAMILADGKIQAFGKEKDLEAPIGAAVIDAGGAYVGPGFVDIHVHGGGGFSTCLEPKQAAEHFLAHGETSILAGPAYSMDFQETMEAIATTNAAMPEARTVRGLYLEGPFTNPMYGAMADLNPWRREIPPEEFKQFVDAAGTNARVWTIAPERPDVMPFLQYARQVNPNVMFAVGHSNATPMQIRALGNYRPTIQTHAFDATGRQPVPLGTRGYGPDEYCLRTPEVYNELICDSCGQHVHPEMQQLMLHCKGAERIILITDSTNYDYPNPPELAHVTDLNFDHKGDLCGSKMTMDQACRNMMESTNAGIAQVFLMAATNPARAVGLEELGVIETGKNADLVITDDRFHIQRVLVDGQVRY